MPLRARGYKESTALAAYVLYPESVSVERQGSVPTN
jgi:hypothetical protein